MLKVDGDELIKLDNILFSFIEKYPFIVDPIVLFNPTRIPEKEEILTRKLNLKYQEIDKNLKQINSLKNDLDFCYKEYNKISFSDKFLGEQYELRLGDFMSIIRLIEIFYNEDEQEKFDIICDYFGINIQEIERGLLNDKFTDVFAQYHKLFNERVSGISDRFPSEKVLNDREIQHYFNEAIGFLKISDCWDIEINDAVSIVHTDFDEKGGKIIIPKGRTMTCRYLVEVIAHEIDAHCVQFSNSKKCGLFSGSLRFSKSECILEGLAKYLEILISAYFFGDIKMIEINHSRAETRFNLLTNKVSIDEFSSLYKGQLFRNFRGFQYVKNYMNIKDFVYFQGLNEVIDLMNTYENFWELIFSGVVNRNYIEKFGSKGKAGYNIDYIESLSSNHIFKELLNKQ